MPFSPRNLKIKKIYNGHKNFFLLPLFFAGIALVAFFSSSDVFAAAGINEEISFQGKVVNDDGTNVANGNYDFVFQLYTVSSAGTAVWTETRTGGNQVTVTDGIFQVNLGSVTTLPGSVDFNTDNIYLGIEFNSDGEMSPRVHFTAAPYAMNAAKVGGLTVTDTTGTLTIPNGKTISFADAFATSGAFATTLTATATTNVTLPTTGTLATLAGSETFTNKTIGSTGLVFSGATTDITTASNEDLTLTAAGSGDIVLVLDSGTFVNLTGGADGTAALTLAAGDLTLTDGDLIVTAGDANFTLDVADTFNIVKSGADAGDIANITASSVNAIDGLQIDLTATTDSGADSVTGLDLAWTESADADVWTALNLPNTTTTNSSTRAFVIGTGYDTILDTAALDISGAGVISGATGISTTTLTASSAIAANGGITFDASTDTLSAFTLAGTLDASTNILTNIGNAGTDFVASTGALTLAGVLTADGGISLSASQSLTAVALSYIDLGAITHGTTAVQGLRLPQAASASPSSPTSGEGYLAWDAAGNQLIYYTGAAWSTISGGSGYSLIKDEATGLTARTTLAFLGAGVSCADNASQTECTISGGGSSDLQATYGNDADGSDATISLTTADDSLIFTNPTSSGTDSAFLLQISQQHTTAAVVALDITQSSSGANGLNLTANAIDTETALAVTANALTSGFGLSIASSSAALTGALQSITLSGSNASNTGSLLALDNTGTSNANTSLYIKHYATGTNNLAFRIDDVSGDITPFVVDGTGAVGIGTTAPTSLFELYGTGAADIVGTLTAPDATYDPIFKFRTGLTPAVMFSMGIDNSDSDKFKIYSGDGLGSGDEFVIDASGVTTIANLNLGATSFDENAGIVSWMDMAVTASSAVDTVESYSALIDGNSLLTVYAESDGADGIQDKRIQIGEGGAGSTGPTLLALDVKSNTSDPAGFEGAMYYNTFDNVFRCYQNSGWTNCIGSGGSSDLQTTYDTDADGSNATISLTSADDGLVFSNPASSGTDSAFTFKVEQLNTGIDNDALYIDNRGTGDGLRIDDVSGDTTPFIVDASGKVGIQTSAPAEALQVGSSANRANISAYGDITSEGYDIQRTLAGIIDIFVYDTTRDSDSGEWRSSMLSQQLSWATETKDNTGADCVIATDDRCGKSVFPRKAILATTADSLYIFDGADNTLWMKFTQAGTYALGADTSNNPSGVGAQNGVIVVGTNGASATGMYTFDFKQDTMFRYNVTNRVMGDKNIGNRNSTVTYATDANTNFALADTIVNDVSIAMITSSTNGMANTLTLPTDSATSPVRGMTLVAAATDTAISVVNMAARKTLSYSDATGNDYNQVVMTSRARLYATNETLGQLEEWRDMDREVVAEINGTPTRTYDELTPTGAAGKTPITTGTAPTINTTPGSLAVIERASSARESAATTLLETGDIVFVGTDQGLAEVHTSGGNLAGASWSKLTTTTVATPYMVGAPRGAFLFEEAAGATATTSAIGTAGSTKNVLDSAVTGTDPTFGADGVRGTSVNFNNNSYLCTDADANGTCDSDTDFNAGTIGFTISLWFKHGTTAAADTLFERCYTPATPTAAVGCIYAGMHTTGQIRFAIDSLTTWTYNTTYDDTILSTASYNDDQWHHAVFTNTDTDICMYIDGKQAVACDTAIAATATMDAAQVLTVGGSCAGANCVTGANFWDGRIDDFVWSSNGATTDNGVVAQSATKLYLDGRAHLIRPSDTVADATAFSSTTIGDSAEAYIPGSFVGLVAELTGGTGSGQTRTIISNDATTFTVYPAFTTTPDATTDYRVNAAKLYGATNSVKAVAVDAPTNLNKVRKVYIGTSDGSDGGGVSVFTNAGTGSIKTEVIHSDAAYATDDLGSTWSGTDADDISAIASYSDTVAMGSGAFLRAQRKEISLKQLQLDTIGGFEDIRQELVAKQLFGSTQDVLGLGQGADLAERYYSDEKLNAGEIIALDSNQEAGIKRSTYAYQRDVLGVVSTAPGIILGPEERVPYPVALVGRVPVKVTNENGAIYAGDRITASSRPGYGMFASQAGRVVGTALADGGDWITCEGEDPESEHPKLCTTVLVFVNLTDYSGQSVELAMAERGQSGADGLSDMAALDSEEQGLGSDTASIRLSRNMPTKQEKILDFLKDLDAKQVASGQTLSEVFTGRVAASREVITPTLYADQIFARSIKADSIEGLEIFTNQISSLEEKYAGLDAKESDSSETTDTVKEQLALAMKKLTADTLILRLDGSILGKLSVNGALKVGGTAEFGGETVFVKLASFLDKTIFKGMVSFESAPTFASDTAGFAVIAKDARRVRVVFDTPYEKQPIVTVSLTREESPLLSEADEDLKKDIALLEEEYVGAVFKENVRYVVTEKSANGFTIVLSEKASRDLQFSWVALSVDKAKSFSSEPEEGEAVPPLADPTEEISPIEEEVEGTEDILPLEEENTETLPAPDISEVPIEEVQP